jgi:hypothetical protein
MSDQDNLQPQLRKRANETLTRLGASEREALLIKGWMSHDARWFMAVAGEYGMAAANRLNQVAARAAGKVEAQRITRALQLPPRTALDDYLLAQEILVAFLGPDLIEYGIFPTSDRAYRMNVRRCFAYDNAVRAGIAEQYACGIFARVAGWFDALGLAHEINPALGQCLKAQGRECVYTITLRGAEGGLR